MINDIAIAKEKLQSLSDIDTGTVKIMTKSQLFSYVQALNVTASAFPLQREELEYALSEKNYAAVFQWLEVIRSSLSQMHADDLARECEKQINLNQDLSNVRHEKVQVFVNYFMPTLDLFFADVHQVLEDLEVNEVEKQPQSEVGPKEVREKLHTISELDSNSINVKTDEELCGYIQILNAFPQEFLAQENGLKSSIKIKHYVFVLQWLTAIEETLIKIHANELAGDCRNQININKDFNNIRHEKLEVFINYFLSSLSMLSEDIKSLNLPKQLIPVEDKSDAPKQVAVEVEILSPGSSYDAKTILVINKMTMFMNSLKNALGDVGHKMIGVTTAESAVGYLKTAKPDLFIIDEDLPGTGSYMLTKVIRATGQMAPIVFTTSKITKDKMVKFMEIGVADFIMKPITPADVQKKVSKHLP